MFSFWLALVFFVSQMYAFSPSGATLAQLYVAFQSSFVFSHFFIIICIIHVCDKLINEKIIDNNY